MKIQLLAKNVINFIVDVITDVFYNIPVRLIRKFVIRDIEIGIPTTETLSNILANWVEVLLVTALLSIIPVVGISIAIYGIVLRLLLGVEVVVIYVIDTRKTSAEPVVA